MEIKEKLKAFDFKKEYKEFYMPKNKPSIVALPAMNYVAVRGKGDPNSEDSEYKASIGLLYGIAFTIKMSKLTDHRIDGYFDFVVPPLEGLWQMQGGGKIDYSSKEGFEFVSMIRLPVFVTKDEFDWAVAEAAKKKGIDFSGAEFFSYNEGLCVQCMHIGPYDSEPDTLALMDRFAEEQGYKTDISEKRLHHEIYLSDPRKCAPERLKTVLRHPIRSMKE